VHSLAVAKENQFEAFIGRFDLPCFDKTQGFAVKTQTLFEIPHIDVVVVKSEFHRNLCTPVLLVSAGPGTQVSPKALTRKITAATQA
jgi:hypothetical protein